MERILAFDSGTKLVHWALLEGDKLCQRFIRGGSIEATAPSIQTLLENTEYTLGAVEVIEKYYAGRRHGADVSSLMLTARVSGMVIGLLHPAPVFTMIAASPAGQTGWRGYLTGLRAGSDSDVKNALLQRGIIGATDKTTVHTRDAAGLAAVALMLKNSHW